MEFADALLQASHACIAAASWVLRLLHDACFANETCDAHITLGGTDGAATATAAIAHAAAQSPHTAAAATPAVSGTAPASPTRIYVPTDGSGSGCSWDRQQQPQPLCSRQLLQADAAQ